MSQENRSIFLEIVAFQLLIRDQIETRSITKISVARYFVRYELNYCM